MVECHASDLIVRVRFPLPAPIIKIIILVVGTEISRIKNKVSKIWDSYKLSHILLVSHFALYNLTVETW